MINIEYHYTHHKVGGHLPNTASFHALEFIDRLQRYMLRYLPQELAAPATTQCTSVNISSALGCVCLKKQHLTGSPDHNNLYLTIKNILATLIETLNLHPPHLSSISPG